MPRLLVVHHTPSPALHELLTAVREGAALVEGVDVAARPALTCSPVEVLECDGLVLGTPANIGYMSGALKHFFDTAYYPPPSAAPTACTCTAATTSGAPSGRWRE